MTIIRKMPFVVMLVIFALITVILAMLLRPVTVNADFQQNATDTITPTPTTVATSAPTPTEQQLRNDALLIDTSLVDGDPCGPPCWRGIIAGETSWQDAITIIADDDTLTQPDIRTSNDSDIQGALWAEVDGDDCCQMYTEDGETVDVIILQTAPNMIFGKVIENYGDPSYLIGEEFRDNQGLMSIFYPELRMVVYVFAQGVDTPISPESEIIGFGYFSQNRMDVLLLTNELQAWEGFDSIDNYMSGEFEITPSVTLTPTTTR